MRSPDWMTTIAVFWLEASSLVLSSPSARSDSEPGMTRLPPWRTSVACGASSSAATAMTATHDPITIHLKRMI